MRNKKLAIKVATSGYFVPVYGGWGKKDDKDGRQLANSIFEDLRPGNDYVVIVKSYKKETRGYWIETIKKCVTFPDKIVKGGSTIQLKTKKQLL